MKVSAFVLLVLATALSPAASESIDYSGYYTDLVRLTPELDDQSRIPLHFDFLLKKFRAKDISSLGPELRAAREMNLRHLEEYRDQGRFPINEHVAWRQPVFIDNYGTHCAVGYLVMASGHPKAARAIADRENLAYVKDIRSPELDPWIASSGLSKEECAMIQPSYYFPCPPQPCPTPDGTPPSIFCNLYRVQSDPAQFQLRIFAHKPVTQVSAVVEFLDGTQFSISSMHPSNTTQADGSEFSLMNDGTFGTYYDAFSSVDVDAELIAAGVEIVSKYASVYGVDYSLKVSSSRYLDYGANPQLPLLIPSYPISGCSDDPYAACYKTNGFFACGTLGQNVSQVKKVTIKVNDLAGNEFQNDGTFKAYEIDSQGVFTDPALLAASYAVQMQSEFFMPKILNDGIQNSLCLPLYETKLAPSPTPQPALCGPRVEKVVVAPSPLYKIAGSRVAVYLSGCADKLRCHVYTSGNRHVKSWEAPASGVQGWQSTPLPEGLDIANGQYFIKVEAIHGDKRDSGTSGFYVLK